MSSDEIVNIHLQTLNTSWDFYVDPQHTLADISEEKVRKLIAVIEQRTGKSTSLEPMAFLTKLEALRDGKLTFVADYCSTSDIQVGRFKNATKIIDSISFNADLFSEVEDVLAFIRKHLMVEYIITGAAQRTERFDYPEDAIREIVINMIVHRDYRSSAGSIIKIFDDRIEFYNPGKLYGGLTVDDLLSGSYVSQARNKLVAKLFKEAGMIERYGSGIARIQTICADYGIVTPEYKEIGDGFMVVLFKKKLNETIDISESTEKSTEKIIEIMKANPGITIKSICDIMNMSDKGVRRNINKLKTLGILTRIGPYKGGYWQVNEEINKH